MVRSIIVTLNYLLGGIDNGIRAVAYVINEWYIGDNEARKYISAKVRLEYDDYTFAEYERIYDLDGNGEDDYLREV